MSPKKREPPSETRDPDWILDLNRKCNGSPIPSSLLVPPSGSLESPSADADEEWDRIRSRTTTFVDTSGGRWAGKPGYPVRPFMQAIYIEAHRRAGKRLGVPTRSLVHDGIHMVSFTDLCLWRQKAFGMSFEELEDLLEQQRLAMAVYLVACRLVTEDGADCRRWLEAYVRANMMIGLSHTVQEACERLMYVTAAEEGIPRDAVDQARSALSKAPGLSEATLATAHYNEILETARNDGGIREALRVIASTGRLEPLERLPQKFSWLMKWHATHSKVVRQDELDVPLTSVLISLAQKVTASLSEAHPQEAPRDAEMSPGNGLPRSGRLGRYLGLTLMAERVRQDAHHQRALGHRIFQLKMAPFVDALMRNGRVHTCAEVFAKTPDWWIEYAAGSCVAKESNV